MNKRITATLAALTVAAAALAGCSSTQTQTSQCGFVITNGFQQNHGVKSVIYPGDSTKHDGSDQVWFVPCNARNFIVTPDSADHHGDRHTPVEATTAGSEDGKTPGVPVNVWLSMHWTLNEDKAAMTAFWALCQKYTCASDTQNANNANFSTAGWNGMLAEQMSSAIDRATKKAVAAFGPDLWVQHGQAKATDLAAKVSTFILTEIKANTGSAFDYFCSTASDTRNGKQCAAPTFTVESVDPVDANLQNIQNSQTELQAQQAQNALRLANAQQLYGPYANYFLGIQDTITACKAAGQNCTVVLGNGSPAVPSR